MKKYLKWLRNISISVFTLVIFIMGTNIYASNNEYYIESYDIKMDVNEDNTFDITETIIANFNVDKHGIFRILPLKNRVERVDGTTSENIARISNIKVNEKYTTSKEEGNKVIKIGDKNVTLTGRKEYVISYRYNIGKDPLENKDELYFNLIGTEWDTSIDNVTFTINMPKDFDSSKLGFSVGYSDSTNSDGIEYQVNGNVITGRYTKTLDAWEGLTVRLELPEEYFKGESLNLDWSLILAFVFPVVFVIIIAVMWVKKGKDDVVVETVEFYPPEGYNSAEIDFLYKGKTSNEGIISLLIELANEGYIKIIEEIKEGKRYATFRIVKLKAYDGEDANKRIFFDGLFEKRTLDIERFKKISFKDIAKINEEEYTIKTDLEEVTEEDLTDSFYVTINKISEKIASKENKLAIFEKGMTSRIVLGIFMVLFTFIYTTWVVASGRTDDDAFPMLIIVPLFFGIMNWAIASAKSIFAWVIMLGFDVAGIISVGQILVPIFIENWILLAVYIITVICCIVIAIFTKLMPKRTKFGIEMLGKIRGFKNFLEVARKEELETLVEKNSEYFYDILPYTYALGVSDKWIEKFETIAIKPATWCEGTSMTNGFDMKGFSKFMDNTMSAAQSSMSSRPSSDGGSGGGSSGGGSSGGGSGGGGGGSW